jgi:hypothetical protein
MYAIIDIRTKETVAICKTRKVASNKADKMDLAFGAIRYSVKYI